MNKLKLLWAAHKLPIILGGIALLIAAFFIERGAYGSRRYNAGVEATDAKWEAASAKLKEQAAQSATKADDAAADRLEKFVEQATEDEKAVEDAKANGSSPLDALFGG